MPVPGEGGQTDMVCDIRIRVLNCVLPFPGGKQHGAPALYPSIILSRCISWARLTE
jgi:hypothetical protein